VARVVLIAHALSPSLRHQVLGGDDEPDPAALAAVVADGLDLVVSSPARAAVRTSEALGAVPVLESALRDREHGAWTGRRYAELVAEEPAAVRRWLADPDWAPPGGESVREVVDRVGAWLDTQAGQVVAVTHPAVIRAAVIYVLQAPLDAYGRIDVRPLTTAQLTEHRGRWNFVA
jgi:broad specificity phosphatase PhoE